MDAAPRRPPGPPFPLVSPLTGAKGLRCVSVGGKSGSEISEGPLEAGGTAEARVRRLRPPEASLSLDSHPMMSPAPAPAPSAAGGTPWLVWMPPEEASSAEASPPEASPSWGAASPGNLREAASGPEASGSLTSAGSLLAVAAALPQPPPALLALLPPDPATPCQLVSSERPLGVQLPPLTPVQGRLRVECFKCINTEIHVMCRVGMRRSPNGASFNV